MLAALSLLFEAGGEPARAGLRFERAGLAAGEWWRLVSGHLVHLGPSHMLLNVAALLLLWWLVGSSLTVAGWCLVIAASLASIDLGLWFLDPALSWYVGLSGLLHGLFAAGLVARRRSAPVEALVLGTLLAAKLLFEQIAGPLPGSETSAGGAVVVNAHLYGAAGGLVAALGLRASVRARLPI